MRPTDKKIYLASKSPRRRELLRQIGVEFELLLLRDRLPRGPEVDEAVRDAELPLDYVQRVCEEKGECARKIMLMRRLPIRPILSADTTVVLDNAILGKPADAAEGAAMLRRLSGRSHQVLTSITLLLDDQTLRATHTSTVTLATLSENTIQAYCATQEPYDKAGGYAIQGLAAMFVEQISGSYSGIMGLPLHETARLLEEAGIKLL